MTATQESDTRLVPEQTCPVPDCTYHSTSTQAVMAHVGSGHAHGWDETDATPADVHEMATKSDLEQAVRRGKVREWLKRNSVTTDVVRVYVHQGYDSVQVRVDGPLSREEWVAFTDLVRETEGVRYNGDVNWCTDEFVTQLPSPETFEAYLPAEDDEWPSTPARSCSVDGCSRTEGVDLAVREDGAESVLCPYHRKEFVGVTS